jgi:hypothetical protein
MKRKKKKELYDAVRLFFNEPYLPNLKVQEFLKKPADINKNPTEAEIHLYDLTKEKDQRELSKKPPDKPWISRTKCKGLAELFYEEFILEKKGVSTRRYLSENCKISRENTQCGSLSSMKKVLCALIMIQGLVTRRRDLNEGDYLPSKLIGGKKEEATTGAISIFLERGS